MFELSDSTQMPRIRPWIAHYLLAVVLPIILLELLNGLVGFNYANRSAGQAIVEYSIVGAMGFGLGLAAHLSQPLTASVAQKAWIFPVFLFVFAVCWDLHASRFNWRAITSEYIIFLPDSGDNEEPWVSYWVFSFPCLAAISYSLGSKFRDSSLFKAVTSALRSQ